MPPSTQPSAGKSDRLLEVLSWKLNSASLTVTTALQLDRS